MRWQRGGALALLNLVHRRAIWAGTFALTAFAVAAFLAVGETDHVVPGSIDQKYATAPCPDCTPDKYRAYISMSGLGSRQVTLTRENYERLSGGDEVPVSYEGPVSYHRESIFGREVGPPVIHSVGTIPVRTLVSSSKSVLRDPSVGSVLLFLIAAAAAPAMLIGTYWYDRRHQVPAPTG